MNVLLLSSGADTGGQGVAIAKLFARQRGWRVRSAASPSSSNYFGYDEDLVWPRDEAEIRRAYERADLVHVRTNPRALERFDNPDRPSKPIVMHHHGTVFRRDPLPMLEWAAKIGASTVVSTLDLTVFGDVTWLPAPHDLSRYREIRAREYRRGSRLRIAHAPTVRGKKNTREFLVALRRLAKRFPIEVDVIERVSREECLARKARADIFLDQLSCGYGNNALEAWAMGIPVVAGARDPKARKAIAAHLGEAPFLEASPRTVEQRIEDLLNSSDVRERYAQRGQMYVEAHHAPERVRERLKDIWCAAAHRDRKDIEMAEKLVKITLKTDLASSRGVQRAGTEISRPERVAERMVARGCAEYIDASDKPSKSRKATRAPRGAKATAR